MTITVNGQHYDNWDALPAAVREQLSRTGHAGPVDPAEPGTHLDPRTVIEVNGRAYTSLDDLPAEIRETLEQALGGLLGRHPEPPAVAVVAPRGIPAQRSGT